MLPSHYRALLSSGTGPPRARVAFKRIARRPNPLPPLSPEMEAAVIQAVNEARRFGPGTVNVESDHRGDIRVTRPEVTVIQAPRD